jgi:hypothetical protein
VAANIGAIDVRVSVTVAVRGVAVTCSGTDNRGRTRVMGTVVTVAARVRIGRCTAMPTAPGGFGRNRRGNDSNQAENVEPRNHGNQNRNVMLTTRMLAAAIIRISEPSKVLNTRNIGTFTVPRDPHSVA